MAETYKGWATKFLGALGAPVVDSNLLALYSIIQSEGTSINWNPLAITGAGVPGNSVGVGNFPDEVSGITATVNFLNTPGSANYPGRIVAPLKTGNGHQAILGFDATGSWTNSKVALQFFNTISGGGGPTIAQIGNDPLLADPGHGLGDPGGVSGSVGAVFGVPSLDTGLAAIGHFFGILADGKTWIRVGEIIGGVLLIALAFGLVNKDIFSSIPGKSLVNATMEAVT